MLDIYEKGVTVKFKGQTFKVARYCMRKHVDPKDAGEDRFDGMQIVRLRPSSVLRKRRGCETAQLAGEGVVPVIRALARYGPVASGSNDPGIFSAELSVEIFSAPSYSAQVPSRPPLSLQVPPKSLSSGKNGAPTEGAVRGPNGA